MVKFLLISFCFMVIVLRGKSSAEISERALLKNDHEGFGSRIFRAAVRQDNQTDECDLHMEAILNGILNREMWAIEMIDSWGKIPSGILYGNLASIGNFDQCLSVIAKANGTNQFRGKFCMSTIPISGLIDAVSEKQSKMMPTTSGSMGLSIGTCIPDTCDANKISTVLVEYINKYLNLNITGPVITEGRCSTSSKVEFRPIDWVALALFSIFGLLLLLSTLYEYLIITKGGQPRPIFVAFSAISNGRKMFQMQSSSSPNAIECLHGIRSLSLIWVVFGHSYALSLFITNINFKYISETWAQSPFSMVIQNNVSVDSFFLMSGLLVSWLSLQELKKRNGSLNIFLLYFHRYIRLTPVLAAIILFVITFGKYLGSGPFWADFQMLTAPACEENWWATLLYVQNYVHPDKLCLSHSWYLACDTQMFIISPFLMLALWRWGWKTAVAIFILMALSIGCTIATFIKNEFGMFMFDLSTIAQMPERMKKIYYPTHTRMAPWLLGLLLGYFLFHMKNKRFHLSKFTVLLAWLASITLSLVVLFGVYPKHQPNTTTTTLEGALYESLSRTSWAVSLAWIIFACHKGYGGPINSFLSFPFWQPISRLSYSIYLVSFPLQSIVAGLGKTETHFSDFEAMYRFWGDFAFTFLISILVSLTFEAPIIGLERMLLPQKKPAEQRQPEPSAPEATSNENGSKI